jgi:hypothetical protein
VKALGDLWTTCGATPLETVDLGGARGHRLSARRYVTAGGGLHIPADLHRLEGLAARAVRHSQGSPTAVKALITARRRHEELMLQAVDSPGVTSGSACILDAGART